jgi:SAM-dependent methyltransferase
MDIKGRLQDVIDRVQFRYDLGLGLQYQPLPWIGRNKALRGVGTAERWSAISRELAGGTYATAMDVGSNVGFFLLALAETGIATVGVEMHEPFFRISRYAARRLRAKAVGHLLMEVTPDTVRLLPRTDIVIFLSVFHHWAKTYGFETATGMLRVLWSNCGRVLFFETGQSEMPSEYNLPNLQSSSREWLTRFLCDNCAGGEVVWLGSFKAFGPGGNEARHVVDRDMFGIRRA